MDIALDPTAFPGELEDEDEGEQSEVNTAAAQKKAQRAFKKSQKEITAAAKKKATQLIAKKVAQQGVVRSVALACGSTGVGLIVTYLIWTLQAIVANWLEHDKIIPKLEWWELILWALLTILLAAILIMLLVGLVILFALSNPFTGSAIIAAIGGSIVWGYISSIWPF